MPQQSLDEVLGGRGERGELGGHETFSLHSVLPVKLDKQHDTSLSKPIPTSFFGFVFFAF